MSCVSDQRYFWSVFKPLPSPYTALPSPQVTIYSRGSSTVGHALSLICSVVLVPYLVVEPSIVWTKQDNVSRRMSLDSNVQLDFIPLRTSDGGHYTCTVTIDISDETSVSANDSLNLCFITGKYMFCKHHISLKYWTKTYYYKLNMVFHNPLLIKFPFQFLHLMWL